MDLTFLGKFHTLAEEIAFNPQGIRKNLTATLNSGIYPKINTPPLRAAPTFRIGKDYRKATLEKILEPNIAPPAFKRK